MNNEFKSQLINSRRGGRRKIHAKIYLSQTGATNKLPSRMKLFLDNNFMKDCGLIIGDIVDLMYCSISNTWAINKNSQTGFKIGKLSNVTSGFAYKLEFNHEKFNIDGVYEAINESIEIENNLITFRVNKQPYK